MSKIDKKLQQWQQAGLISEDQKDKIQKFEDEQPTQNWILYGFLGLGAVIILVGVISLIAANWKAIPSWLKLSTHFGLFAFFIWLTHRLFEQGKELYYEVSLTFLMLYSFASIGLVSQIYHTGGQLYQAGLLWSFMNFGFLFLTKHKVIPSIWAGVFFSSLTVYCWADPTFEALYRRNLLPLFLGLPFFCFGFTFLFKKYGGEYAVTNVFRKICFVIGVIGLMAVESNVSYLFQKQYLINAFLPSYLLMGAGIFALAKSDQYRTSQKKLLTLLISLYALSMHLPVLRINQEFFVAALTIAILILAAIYMGSLKYKKLFETFLIFVFLRVFILYLQALGGLAQTGIGLIVSGLIMIGMVLLWQKNRVRISQWANGVL
jgi:uncharacterized membrane protein